MNAIQNFFLQLWTDLRARRLLPVAGLLVAGLIAAPIVLSKGSEEPPAPATEASTPQPQPKQQGPEALAQVKLEEDLEGNGSSLSAFDVSNPFAPPKKVVDKALAEAQGTTGESAPSTGTTGTTGSTGDTGSTGGDTGSTGGGTPDTGTGGDQNTGGDQTKTTEFTYVLDVTFWANGKKRTIKGMEKLDMLPSQVNPLLIFMGVSDNAGNAVFLVDSTLKTTGEGKCKPSQSDCAFLYLGAGAEQEFTNDEGDSYRLLINEIRKVKVDGQSDTDANGAKGSKTARASVGAQAARRFAFPLLTDVVAESGSTNGNSTGADKRR
jgi:hypothetical protein